MKIFDSIKSGYLFIIMSYAGLCVALYQSAASNLLKWWQKGDYSYCYLMPFIIGYLLWEKQTHFALEKIRPNWNGILVILTAILFYWLGELGGEFYSIYLSFWLLIMGLCMLHLGIRKMKPILFPLFMILSMFPFPNFINNRITLSLKIVSSKIGVMMMRLYGMSAFREGNVIDLGFTKLQVVDACSGLRYLFPMLILSVLVAYFFKARIWKRIVLVLSSVPLTVFFNALRIALTGILSEKFGSQVVEGVFHDFEGWAIFMVTLGVLLGEIWVLSRIFSENTVLSEKESVFEFADEKYTQEPLHLPRFIVASILIALTLILTSSVEFRPRIPMNKAFNQFPMQIDDWSGTAQVMEDKFIDVLDLSDYVMADYVDKQGQVVNFYVAYYENQQKGESIHSPATCLRGGGWEFKQSGKVLVPLGDNRQLSVSRALIQKGVSRQISYYWFPMRGRNLTNAYEMKWFNFWDALTRQRTDGALVRVIVPVGDGESIATAENRLQAFVKAVVPVLNTYLPGA